jgi:lysophospholipase L1-like esterase
MISDAAATDQVQTDVQSTSGSGGQSTGGTNTGGNHSGDASSGGAQTGGASTGGVASGGTQTGGTTSGGANTGGMIVTATPTIFLASDSTVRTYPKSTSLQQGWGQRLAEFLTENVKIENRALGGRAIVQFYTESRSFPQIMKDIKPGDYVFIAFGINDRGDVPDQNVFRDYLKKYITETRAKQGIPVIVTPTPRQQHENGVFTNAFAKYCESDFIVGEATGTPVIDLQTKGLNFFTQIGPDKVKSEMMIDALHYKQLGAYHMARLVAEGLSEITLPLSQAVIKANLDPARTPTKDGW